MNEYYHAFKPGFNWWYIAAPMMFVLCVLFATLFYQLRIRRRDARLRMKQNYKQLAQLVVAVPCTIIVTWMMTVESWNGFVQFFDNRLAKNDSPVWSLILAAFAIVVIMAILFGLYYEVAYNLGRAIKCGLYRKQIKVWELKSKIVPIPDQTLVELERRNWK